MPECEQPLFTVRSPQRVPPLVWTLTNLPAQLRQRIARVLGTADRWPTDGAIEVFEDIVRIERRGVAARGEPARVQAHVPIECVRRLDFQRPGTIALGWGLTGAEATRHVAVSLSPLDAEDAFDELCALLEEENSGALLSIRHGDTLSYSRDWSLDELFDDVAPTSGGVLSSREFDGSRVVGWTLATDRSTWQVAADHGLRVTDGGGDPWLQVLHGDVLHNLGLTLATLHRRSRGLAVRFGTGIAIEMLGDTLLHVGDRPIGSISGDPVRLRLGLGTARLRVSSPLPEPLVLILLCAFLARGGEIGYGAVGRLR